MRRLASGLPGMLLATLLLVSRLVAPSMAMPAADPVDVALQTICHIDASGQPASPDRPDHAECLLCPACHLVSQAVVPSPATPNVPPPPVAHVGASTPWPPSIGPPRRARATAQPTGPPSSSA